jgi:hypothetical protein
MSKYILGILLIALSFGACNNPNEKEIEEVNALIAKATETEKSLLSLDTSKVFGTKRQFEQDLGEFTKIGDTLTKDDAFKISDIFGSKKKFYRLTAGYPQFVNQIETSKKQLNALKQDLENGLIKKENYATFYSDEKAALKNLDVQINKLVSGIDVVVEKYETDRPELLKLINELKLKSAGNE